MLPAERSLVEVFSHLSHDELSHLALLPSGDTTTSDPIYNEHVIVRTYPAPHHGIPNPTTNEAQQLIEESQRHFYLLRECGIEVPTVIFGQVTPEATHTAIVSIVERVDGEPFGQYWNWPQLGRSAQFQRHATRLVESLIHYYNLAISEGGLFLADIGNPLQYRLTGENVTLIDTDPLMAPVFADMGQDYMMDRLNDLLAFAQHIQDDLRVPELLERIASLKNEYRAQAFLHDIQNTNILYKTMIDAA